MCEISPLTFESQFHFNYVAQGHFKNFPNDKRSRRDMGACKVPGLRFDKEEDKVASGLLSCWIAGWQLITRLDTAGI